MASEVPTIVAAEKTVRAVSSAPQIARQRWTQSDEGFWEDLTTRFRDARTEMETGELLHLDSFNLHTAMSAIELMDPKMDIGFGEVRNAAEVSLPSHLSDAQVINIMDELIAREMSWFDAHTLPQTVFACVYTQRMYEVPRFELFSFIQVLLATMDTVLNLILEEKVADEEDFIASTYGFNLRPLCSDPPEDDSTLLTNLLQKLEHRPVEDTEAAISLANAITLRVQVQVELYRAIQCLSGLSFENFLSKAPELLERLTDVVTRWSKCPHKKNVDKKLIHEIFDPSINRHLMTSSPPRTAPLFNCESATKYFVRLLDEWSKLVHLETVALPGDTEQAAGSFPRCSLQVAMHSIEMYSAATSPTAVTRSLMSRVMVPEYTSALFMQEDADYRRLIATDMGLTNEMVSSKMMAMLATVREGTVDIFKCFCRNKSRQRRQVLRLARWWDHYAFLASSKSDGIEVNVKSTKDTGQTSKMDGPLNSLRDSQDDKRLNLLGRGDAVDSLFAAKSPLQIVSYELTARLMIRHWLLGFECNLYQEYEYAAVFFYVGYVLTTMANATTSLAEKSDRGASLHPLRFALYTMDEARLWMCRALHSALEALSRGKQWNYSSCQPNSGTDSGPRTFASEKLWYEQRFGVAQGMVNGPVYADHDSFLSFKKVHEETLLAGRSTEDLTILLLQDAAKGFLIARRTLERARKHAQLCSENTISEEILQIARVAVENSLALSQLLRSFEHSPNHQSRDAKHDVNFKFVRHRHFPVIEVMPL